MNQEQLVNVETAECLWRLHRGAPAHVLRGLAEFLVRFAEGDDARDYAHGLMLGLARGNKKEKMIS